MKKISTNELLQLTSLLSMENLNIATAKATREFVQDDELKNILDAFIQEAEGKVKGMQQFINDNDIISEVH